MHQDTVIAGVRFRGRFLAVALVFLLALSFGCGIGATAFADEMSDLELSMLDSPLVLDEEFGDGDVVSIEIPSAASSELPPVVPAFAATPTPYVAKGVPPLRLVSTYRTCHPTGPPSRNI